MSIADRWIVGSPFAELATLRPIRTRREASWDRSGANRDFIVIEPGKSDTLLDTTGPGCIHRFYVAPWIRHPHQLREVVLRMYWDDETEPSVEVPLGDFFGIAQCKVRCFTSLMLCVNPGGVVAVPGFNAYFPMPFAHRARILAVNESERPMQLWHHTEYELHETPPPPDIAYFHAQWQRENPTVAEEQPEDPWFKGYNLTGAANYVLLDAEGQGNYIGHILQIDNITGGWWGEGDDMIFIDDDTWPPSYHGTGHEEIHGAGACTNTEYAGPYTGFHLVSNLDWSGKKGMYRFFVEQPVRFQKRIRVTVEHGHNNDLANDYVSVAYWYQREPHRPFAALPSTAERRPIALAGLDEAVQATSAVEEDLWRKIPRNLRSSPEVFRAFLHLQDARQAINDEKYEQSHLSAAQAREILEPLLPDSQAIGGGE